MLKQRSVSGTLALDETASNVDSDYHFSENGKHFEISGKDIIDGDRDELPY